ncbi:glutamate receptor ionotropic, delta-2-like [Portunus trituberculatus]|uniref:glutamate receptor ionotropic, delta-2-like n=1 Tax=Portunus trituberculatus TaxID=210409 RepID=UPI001E1CE488|nr:glutamate receptor ionotropic, delta-2-like [Portunus trituberculatus]
MMDDQCLLCRRYVLVGLTRDELDALTLTHKGRKTEHLVGLVQSDKAGEWEVYINQLYWGPGMRLHATWKNGRFSSPVSPFIDKISDIRGSVLKIAMFEWEPSTLYRRNEGGVLEYLYGRDIEVIRALADVFNFTAEFVETYDGEKWGYPLSNGSWTGLVGMLGRADAELAISNLFVSSLEGRDEYQGYTNFFDTDYSCFLIRTEPPLPRWQSPGLPYTLSTWLAILGSLLVIGVIFNLVALAAADGPDEEEESVNLKRFPAAMLFTISLHLQEPYPALPRRQATRIMVAFMLIYTFILAKSYSCNLTAFLTVARQPTGIDTIKELFESSLPLFENTNYVKASLVQSPNIYLRGLVERHTLVKDLREIMKLVRKGKGVAVVNRSTKEFNINTQLHHSEGAYQTRMMKECFTVYTVAVGIRSHSPLKYLFDKAISKIFESGLVTYWKLDSYTLFKKDKKRQLSSHLEYNEGSAEERGSTKLVPLSLDHLQTAFYVLASSLLSSTLIFMIEVFHKSS